MPVLGERRVVVLLVDPIVPGLLDVLLGIGLGAGLEPRNQLIRDGVEAGVLLGRPRDDQRCPGLVDEDRVDLVDDREVKLSLDAGLDARLHVVAQVVEAELVVGSVGDVRGVALLALRLGEIVEDHADGEAQEAVDLTHPLGVEAGQVVVHGDDVNTVSGERVQVGRQSRDEGLALAGLHLRDLALVEHDPPEQLHVEVALADGSLHGLANRGEGLRDQIVEGLPVLQALSELSRPRAERRVGESGGLGLQPVDPLYEGKQPLELAVVLGADDLPDEIQHRGKSDLPFEEGIGAAIPNVREGTVGSKSTRRCSCAD